jgi:hypothetical protein
MSRPSPRPGLPQPLVFLALAIACLVVSPAVLHAQTCQPQPPNLVGWWRAEMNAQDAIDGNHGSLQNGAGHGIGSVGHAFNFNGAGAYVNLGGSTALAPPTFTIGFWMYARAKMSSTDAILGRWGHSSLLPCSWLFT